MNDRTEPDKVMKIGLLQTGQNRAELARFDEYPVLFDQLLNTGQQTRWCELVTRVLDNEFPDEIRDCEGYIVTGSAAGVYEAHDWMDPLMAFIRPVMTLTSPSWAFVSVIRRLPQPWAGRSKNGPVAGAWACTA